jgi:hypothetical protein
VDPFSTVEAETGYDYHPGLSINTLCHPRTHLGNIDGGEWAMFASLDFADGAVWFEAEAGSGANGGTIELRLDSLDGMVIGTCSVPNTGDWCAFQIQSCSISGANGIHDLYMLFSGEGSKIFTIDWFLFLDEIPTPTPAGTPTPPPTPSPTPSPAPGSRIYNDSLVNDWEDWSWSSTVNPNCSSPVYDGMNSLSVTYNAGYAGLYFHHLPGDIQLSNYTYLSFFIHGGMIGGQDIRISFRNNADTQVGVIRYLNDYIDGGNVSPNTWKEVMVPLADFNISGGLIRKLIFQSNESLSLPILYMDVIGFK